MTIFLIHIMTFGQPLLTLETNGEKVGTCPGEGSPLRVHSYRNKSSGQLHGCRVDLVHVFIGALTSKKNS